MGRGFRVRDFTSELNKIFHDRKSLKCIWNEIFDNNFIVLLESVLKDKINADVVDNFSISTVMTVWSSQNQMKKWQEIEQRSIRIDKILLRHNVCM